MARSAPASPHPHPRRLHLHLRQILSKPTFNLRTNRVIERRSGDSERDPVGCDVARQQVDRSRFARENYHVVFNFVSQASHLSYFTRSQVWVSKLPVRDTKNHLPHRPAGENASSWRRCISLPSGARCRSPPLPVAVAVAIVIVYDEHNDIKGGLASIFCDHQEVRQDVCLVSLASSHLRSPHHDNKSMSEVHEFTTCT